jgi:hypothetical protein
VTANTLPVSDLREGDLVDLEGDPFADPRRDRIAFATEYQTVEAVVRETARCVAVYILDVDCFGFPPGHHVRVASRRA